MKFINFKTKVLQISNFHVFQEPFLDPFRIFISITITIGSKIKRVATGSDLYVRQVYKSNF